MEHEYLLSICMMVKDEEKNLRRCLESLKPVIEKADVELIIVDTGSTDNTVSIASEYTSKVYFHPWNNHFSDMRNITISYAKGGRILILDADEGLLNANELYSLIADKKLQSFNTYVLKIKNLISAGVFTVLPQERVFRNDGEFRYEGTVHNQPRYKMPILSTEIYIDHYGYLFDDKELIERKFIRTGGILKEELKKNPDNPYYRYQMAKSYNAHGDKTEALEEIRKAHRLVSGNQETMKLYAYIYGVYAMICCENNEFDEAVSVCNEGVGIRAEYIDLYFLMATALIKLDRKTEAIESYIKYFDLANRYGELAISSDRAMEMYFMGTSYQNDAFSFITNEHINNGRYDQAYKYIELINDTKVRAALLAKILLKLNKDEELKSLYSQNQDNEKVKDIIISLIEAEKVNNSPRRRKELEQLFSTGEDSYSLLNRIRSTAGEDRNKLVSQALKLADFDGLPDFYADIFVDIDKNTRQLISYFKRMRKSKIKQYFKRMLDNREELKEFLEEYILKENVRSDDIHSLRVFISIAYILLSGKAAKLKDSKSEISGQYYSIFRLYIDRGMKYTALLYNPERLRLYYSTLEDQEDRFFIALYYAIESTNKGDFKAGIKYFREAARANPYLACFMNRYKDEMFPDLSIPIEEDEQNG